MLAKSLGRAVGSLMVVPSAAFALGLGDIHLLSPLNAPLDAEIELVDVTPEELQTLRPQIASRDTFAKYGLDYPVFVGNVQVHTVRNADGREVIKLKSTDSITEPFITLLVEANWARGHLVREYTMLLDPPVYTPGQSPAGNAPVTAPATGTATREGAIARPAAADSSASPNDGGRSRASPAGALSAAGGNGGDSHVVRSGETLSGIAAGASGKAPNSPTTQAWMLAIYQANPSAFERNMNLLRSGALLRLPDPGSVSAVSPSQAGAEIRRQYAEWRGGSGGGTGSASGQTQADSGHLRLVTPSQPGAAGAASGAANQALQGQVKDLQDQLAQSKRLLDMKDAELAQLQARLKATPKGAEAPPAARVPPAPPAANPPPATTGQSAATSPPASTPSQESTPSSQSPPPTPPTVAAAGARRPAAAPPSPASTAAESSGGSIADSLKQLWWVVALAVIALAALIGVRAVRARRQADFDDSLGRLAAGGGPSPAPGMGETAPMRAAAGSDDAFVVEESGAHQRAIAPGAPAPVPSARHVATDQTVSSDSAINLDQGDPLAEADFHMAYGLYDQAADLIKISLAREPNRRDLKLKLLEVYFVWGNKEQFLQSARELAATREQAAPGEWEKIVIMGKQLAPEDPLFAGGSAVSGATAGGVDLDLEGGESRVDFDLLGDPIPGHSADDNVDLDIGSALGATAAIEQSEVTERAPALDWDTAHAGATNRHATRPIDHEPEPLMPDFGTQSEGPTVERPGMEPIQPTVRQSRPPISGDQTAELAIDDLGLDLGALDTVDQPGLDDAHDHDSSPTLVAGLDEHERRELEDAAHHQTSSEGTHTIEREPGAPEQDWRLDQSELESMLGPEDDASAHAVGTGAHETGSHTIDPSSTARLASLSSGDLDFDLGDPAEDAQSSATGRTNGAGLDLDVGASTVSEPGSGAATQSLADEDLALPELEPVTMSEVGTKLDLARAYMDMGDPEGARNILEEVLHEGSVTQKQEAQRLLESLPG